MANDDPGRDRWDSPGARFLRERFLDPIHPRPGVSAPKALLAFVASVALGDPDTPYVPASRSTARGARRLRRVWFAIILAFTAVVVMKTWLS